MQVDFCKTDKDKLEVYASYKPENCMVSGYSVSSGDRPSGSISLNFTKILYEFHEMKAKNEKGDSPNAGWDIGAVKKV
ncbi:MAG TPA: type VI secretion system tube protein Hcp [Gemmataceae bacterium]|nr:type VI secretion system tube protein Hcp [Gemmataceae bacterium]